MAARPKKTQRFLLLLLAVLVVVAVVLLLKKSNPSGLSTTGVKETATPVAQNMATPSSVQGAVSGPIGRNGLRAYAGPNAGEVTLEWQRYFSDGENFSVHYGTVSNQYPYVAQYIGYISTYIVRGLTPGTRYYFVVEGIRAGGVSAGWDGEVSMIAPSGPVAVVVTAGPIGRNLLIAKPGPKKGEVTLNWQRFNPDAEKYNIVYGTTPGNYSYGLLNAVNTTPQDNSYSYVIGALSSGTRYYFALVPQRNGQGIYTAAEVSAVAP